MSVMIPSELSISVFAKMPDNTGGYENFVLITVNANMLQLLQTLPCSRHQICGRKGGNS